MKTTIKNANGSIEEPLALLAFGQNKPYRTVVLSFLVLMKSFLKH